MLKSKRFSLWKIIVTSQSERDKTYRKMILKILLYSLGIVAIIQARTYENYRVYSVVPKTELHVKSLREMQKNGYDFWEDQFKVGTEAMVMVSPKQFEDFIYRIETGVLNSELKIEDVQQYINKQQIPATDGNSMSLGRMSWTRFHTLNEIYGWLDHLQLKFPEVVKRVTMGLSTEMREIKGVIIDFTNKPRKQKPLAGIIEGGMHGREWISPATVTWIIKEFLTSKDADVRYLAENFVWHIFPIVNPDGYLYTFDEDRLWRKNRSPAYYKNCSEFNLPNDMSNGVDLNKNFNFLGIPQFQYTDEPCLQTYAGPRPHTEAETRAIASYIENMRRKSDLIYYLSFHAFGQAIVLPSALNETRYKDLREVALKGGLKMEKLYNSKFRIGNIDELSYELVGSSFEYAKKVGKVPVIYQFELRDRGDFGFLLPTTEIIPNNKEVMAGLAEMGKAVRKLHYYSGSTSVIASMMSLICALGLVIVLK